MTTTEIQPSTEIHPAPTPATATTPRPGAAPIAGADGKLQITWDELKTSKVDKHLRQQQALSRNQRYAKMTHDDLPVSSPTHNSIWYNSILCLGIFGLVGGLLAWSSVILLNLRGDPRVEADQYISYIEQIRKTVGSDGISGDQASAAIHSMIAAAGNNPYLANYLDQSQTAEQAAQKRHDLDQTNQWKNLLTNIIGYGICGLLISLCLSIAEPTVDHNVSAVVTNGSVGALLGLIGGLAASILIDRVYRAVGGSDHGTTRQYLAHAASWAVLGSFTAIAPGVVARNFKRLFIGILGGAIGGAVGGLLIEPITQAYSNDELARLIAFVSIGLITGAATGFIERAARSGWLKVTQGLITGKQFILYRNPTYIGSAPDCQIYLFRDPSVGRRHAALHLLKGRIEIEDLPLGAPTLVNDQPITRQRLRDGDQIRIGKTMFLYQEKAAQS